MAVFAYLFLVAASAVLGLVMYILVRKLKNKAIAILYYSVLGFLVYSVVCTFVFISSDFRSRRAELLYAEQDFLLGTDRLGLFEGGTFIIEYSDHFYRGEYEYKDSLLILNIRKNIFLPFRSDIPETYKIIRNEIMDTKTERMYFKIYRNKIEKNESISG